LWWRSSADQELDVNVFYNDIQDLIQTDTDRYQVVDGVAVYSYKNIANARTYGIETVYRHRLTDAFTTNISHTYTQAENTDSHQTLTRRPDHIVRLGSDWDISEHLSLNGRLRYQSRELSSSDGPVWSPAWTTLDIKLSYQAQPGLMLFGGVDNVTGRQRDFTSGTDFGPVTGRFIYAGITLNY
jgi:outer membrane receptor for ferrienterochelin and colicins